MNINCEPDIEFLHIVRQVEIKQLLTEFSPGSIVLEIGAGDGWQSMLLAHAGMEVHAVDIIDHDAGENQYWPVRKYDGVHLPFPDNYFDILFSSNVLEHVREINRFQIELKRVLRPSGKAIHILPTSIWQISNLLTYHLRGLKLLMGRYIHKGNSKNSKDKLTDYFSRIIPRRHGEFGNLFTEIVLFSKFRWNAHFKRNGWKIDQYTVNGLFYSGNYILGRALSLDARMRISRFLGSVGHVYVLLPTSSVK